MKSFVKRLLAKASILSIVALQMVIAPATFALNYDLDLINTVNFDSYTVNHHNGESLSLNVSLEESGFMVYIEAERVDNSGSTYYALYSNKVNGTSLSFDWDGKINGQLVPNGVYRIRTYAFKPHTSETAPSFPTDTTDGANIFSNPPIQVTSPAISNAYQSYEIFTRTVSFTDSDNANNGGSNNNGGTNTGSNGGNTNTGTNTGSTNNGSGTNTGNTSLPSGRSDDGDISDFELDPDGTWYINEDRELEISWEFDDDMDDWELFVLDDDGEEVAEIRDENSGDEGDYEEFWDGLNDNHRLVSEGLYKVVLRAEEDNGSDVFEVYEYIRIRHNDDDDDDNDVDFDLDVFTVHPVTEDYNYLVFLVDDDNDDPEATVDFENEELVDDEELEEDVYYIVGYEDEFDEDDLDEGSARFKLEIESDDGDLRTNQYFRIDDLDDITKFEFPLVVFDEDQDDADDAEVEFCFEDDADRVVIETYRGFSTSGNRVDEFYDEDDLDEGCYTTVYDDVEDLRDGIYTMVITVEEAHSSREHTQYLRFAVGEKEFLTGTNKSTPRGNDPQLNSGNPEPVGNCGGFTDTVNLASTDPELCAAYEFAKAQGIIFGYSDGTVKGNRLINRAELAAVVFRMYEKPNELVLLHGKSFPDVDPNEWYGPYARTLNFYGVIHGDDYTGNLRPNDNANVAEASKIFWEAGEAFAGTSLVRNGNGNYSDVPTGSWYVNYAGLNHDFGIISGSVMTPGRSITRADVARMVFRMSQAGKL